MVKIRKGTAYRRLERPYTRKSKYRRYQFVRANPTMIIARFESGEAQKKYEYSYTLATKVSLQIRQNAIEAARQSSVRVLEKKLGKTGYHFRVRIYPHHVLRENPLASGAGADRMSTGMQKSFGKSIGLAARVYAGQTLIEIQTSKENRDIARIALERALHKFPCSCTIQEVKLN
ncbi:MAG TPA: 50S ribosomal protein L16 [Candidatus Nanoarchaeia archaeon]|nr:50S ribosomal protein L16 [Candidatus Nanoarchaeia archaeon]